MSDDYGRNDSYAGVSTGRYDGQVNETEQQTQGRWQRRDQRRTAERSRMQKHGARTARIYANAIQKRLRQAATKKKR